MLACPTSVNLEAAELRLEHYCFNYKASDVYVVPIWAKLPLDNFTNVTLDHGGIIVGLVRSERDKLCYVKTSH